MEFANSFIFFGGLLLALSIFFGTVSSRIGAPLLLVFISVGLLFGEDGLGVIVFNDMPLSFTVCSLALAMILFDGGLRTSREHFKAAMQPAILLATLGVLITAVITAVGLFYIKDLPPFEGFLVGATVASTDAAAVFLLLHQRNVRLGTRITSTLEVESGLNDPMAVLLTLTAVHLLLMDKDSSPGVILTTFLQQTGIGLAVGYTFGTAMARLMNEMRLMSGLYPIFAIAGGLIVFGGTHMLHGSGFLAIYITGLVMGNTPLHSRQVVQHFLDGVAWLSQMAMLLILGLLVTPSKVLADIPLALTAAVILIFVARPVAVWLSLIRSRFTWREKTFISWVGLRGAIPIYLAMIPVLMEVPEGYRYFNVAFIVVIISLVLQGWTVNLLAHILRIRTIPEHDTSGEI